MKLSSRIRTLSLATALVAMAGAGTASAQTISWDPRTGDVWVDTWLNDINRYGGRYQQPFVDEMVRYYGAPRDLVTTLLGERGWAPGDVYYACAIAQIIGRPCRYVADEWQQERGEGWGALAQRLGIKPGSPQFHRLKNGMVSSYDRWGRPIRIDEDLYDDYPERARLILEAGDRGDNYRRRADGSGGRGNGNQGNGNNGNDRGGSARGNRSDDPRGNGNSRAAGRGNDDAGNPGRGNSGEKGNRGDRGNGRGNGDKGAGNPGKGNQGGGKGNNGNGNKDG